jgi:hypothetical protein
LTSAARADLGVSDRDGGMIGFLIEQRNWESQRGSGWHGNSRIERLTRLQRTEAEDQELAHGRDDDLFGLEAARFVEARDKSATAGLKRIADSAGM